MKYTIDELKKFKKMLDELLFDKQSEIRDLAIEKYIRTHNQDAIGALLYAVEVKTNEMIYDLEEKERLQLKKKKDEL